MKADLAGQIHELMERGMRPVTMADITSRAPVRMTALERVRSRRLSTRLAPAPGGSAASGSGRGGPRRPRRAILAAAAATAALAIAAAVVIVTSSGGPSRPVLDPGAVRLLAKAADTAARQPAPHVRDSQYMYIETTAAVTSAAPMDLGSTPPPVPRHFHLKLITSRVWVPVGHSCGPVYKRSASPNGKTSIQTYSGAKCPGAGSLNDPTYRLLQTLPTNPHALLALIYRVERGHGPGPDQEAFVTIGDLLRNTIAPPQVAAALYRAAALIPGVTLIPHATDAIGRHGVAVGRIGPGIDGGIREALIFSRATWQLIGERTVIARTGTTTGATAIIDRAFVDHYGQIPHAAQCRSAGQRGDAHEKSSAGAARCDGRAVHCCDRGDGGSGQPAAGSGQAW
jgi:hypothetical protein